MSWNYRICTHLFSYKKAFVNNPKLAEQKDQRIFAIHEVYYNKDGVADGCHKNPVSLGGFEDVEDLKATVDMLHNAYEKPIIDLDNFPNEYEYIET